MLSTYQSYFVFSFGLNQVNHRYRIKLGIPIDMIKDCFQKDDEPASFNCIVTDVPNVNVILKKFRQDIDKSNGLQTFALEVELFAHKEKNLKESLTLVVEGKQLIFEFEAKVLGKGKGTPMLKNGIHVVAKEDDSGKYNKLNTTRIQMRSNSVIVDIPDESDYNSVPKSSK